MPVRIFAPWIALAAILGLAVGGSLVWLSQQSKPYDQGQLAEAKDQHGGGNEAATIGASKKQHGGERDDHWYNTFLEHTPDWFVAIFTLLLVYVTYRLVTSTNRLWEAGERQLKIAETAANAATVAAEAASRSAAISANVERPYVYVSDIELKEIPGFEQKDPPTKTYIPVFIFTNYGRTPAFVTRIGYKHAIVGELPEVPVYKFTDNLTIELVIRPGESYPFALEQPWMVVTKEVRQRSWAGEAFPRFWGQIRYRDFLGGVSETGFVAFQYPDMSLPPKGDSLGGGAFRFTGPPAYTYYRYRADGSPPSEP